ncbi:hypothetical protein [Burkholderia stabilis]|uniref:hypothetical protein n=1 Tax=Burkholderia stabilis TaxID=95485 RepID=UPI0012EACA38|nr:hypothetical protein [Burkholderia stabilis]HDR9494734.1 hypothetical protein [Burkholderia stabilis]HDR9524939.1 hypothetical protein [Burkholderia stabilis]HDR9532702.1 hypothetical protein [Burkholderia stabilis]HDR9541607.1 hypothetical protein [Burkholderia stabilis]HDR9549369.1 hypothetical protein [Burkholderia stabilis]
MNSPRRSPRPLTQDEKEVLIELMRRAPLGAEEFVAQIEGCLIEPINDDASDFDLHVSSDAPLFHEDRLYSYTPVGASYLDTDGSAVDVIVWVGGGRIRTFELVKHTGEALIRGPRANDLFDFVIQPRNA